MSDWQKGAIVVTVILVGIVVLSLVVSKGKLGGAVKSLTEIIGIPQCGACKKRQDYLDGLNS